jgi:hypothetical protein
MKIRENKRIPSNVTVNFHYDNTIYSGTIMNYSDNDMFIKMEMPCRISSTQKQFEVRIPVKDKVLLAIARIKRMEMIGKEFNGIEVELEYPIELDKLLDE